MFSKYADVFVKKEGTCSRYFDENLEIPILTVRKHHL